MDDAFRDSSDAGREGPPVHGGTPNGDAAEGPSPSYTDPQRRSYTDPQRRSEEELEGVEPIVSVVAVDWWEVGWLIEWEREGYTDGLKELERQKTKAQELHDLGTFVVGDDCWMVKGNGVGGGSTSHLEYSLSCDGINVAVSPRKADKRSRSNGKAVIPGDPCVTLGYEEARIKCECLLRALGGRVADEWVRRLDLCLDIANIPVAEQLQPAYEAGFYVGGRKTQAYRDSGVPTGFIVGSGERLLLRVYDKLRDVARHSEHYRNCMIQNRWGGRLPEHATRIEFQIRKTWLDQFGLNDSTAVIDQIPAIVRHATSLEGHAFFRLTTSKPDCVNRHQRLVQTNSLWLQIVAAFRSQADTRSQPLKRVSRGMISVGRAAASILGYVTSAATQRGSSIQSIDDVCDEVRALLAINDYTDEVVAAKYRRQCERRNTLGEAERFRFGDVEHGGSQNEQAA